VRHILTVLLVLVFVFFSLPARVSSQCTRSTNGFVDIATIQNNPFHAEFDATTKDPAAPAGRRRGTMDRDSQGRVRVEYSIHKEDNQSGQNQNQEAEPHNIVICDPVGHTLVQIDVLKHSALIYRVAPPRFLFSNASSPSQPSLCSAKPPSFSLLDIKYEDLGTQTILGLQVHGARIVSSPKPGSYDKQPASTLTYEDWCSEDLAAVVLNDTSVVREGKIVNGSHSSLSNLLRAEPDAALFQIPSGYTVSEKTMASITVSR